jgi:hypothetical protein
MVTNQLPKPEEILARIKSCREETAALKKLLRASRAAQQAEVARKEREGRE